MRTVHKAGLAVAAAVAGLTVAAPAGSAATHDASAASAACRHKIVRWHHTGYYRCGSSPMDAEWDAGNSVDETFVIGPNRHIYHIWANSGGWKEMPGNGRADDTYSYDWSDGYRTVAVFVGEAKWCTQYRHHQWTAWHRCRSGG